MLPKPKHLTPENAAQFKEPTVAEVYHHRLPYPNEVFEIFSQLIQDDPHNVLDVGTGTGDIARNLISVVDSVDAVDFSQAMVEQGKRLPNGDNPNLRWIVGQIEEVQLYPPYALITAGDSIHWMDWEIIFPKFQRMLTANGFVAIVERGELPGPWEPALTNLIVQYSSYHNFESYDLAEELQKRNLLKVVGTRVTEPVTSLQFIEDYVASFHSRGSLVVNDSSQKQMDEFDERLRNLVSPWLRDGYLELQTEARIIWGIPSAKSKPADMY